jgi:hypothetical protein
MHKHNLITVAFVLTVMLSTPVKAQDIKTGFGGIARTTLLEDIIDCRSIGSQG